MAHSEAEQDASSSAVEHLLSESHNSPALGAAGCKVGGEGEGASAGASVLRRTRIAVPALLGAALLFGACLFGTWRAGASVMSAAPTLASSHESKVLISPQHQAAQSLHNGTCSGGHIVHAEGLCLDVDEAAPGEMARLHSCDPRPTARQQRFTYDEGTGALVNAEGLCLDGSVLPELWACHHYESGEDNDWCREQEKRGVVDGAEYKFDSMARDGTCDPCWCCRRQEANKSSHPVHFSKCDHESRQQRWWLDAQSRIRPAQNRTAAGFVDLCLTAVGHQAAMRACDREDGRQAWSLQGDEVRSGKERCLQQQFQVSCRPGQDIKLGTYQPVDGAHQSGDFAESDEECNQRCQNTLGCTFWVRATDGPNNCWTHRGAPPPLVDDASRSAGAPGCIQAPVGASGAVEVRRCERLKRVWAYRQATKQIVVGEDLCLSAATPGSLRLYACDAADTKQRFLYYSSGQIAAEDGGLCIDTGHPHEEGGEIHPWACDPSNKHQRWRIGGDPEAAALPGPAPESPSDAPMMEFYMYRAVAQGALDKYPFGNINTGNMAGVMWYLQNEVVTEYSGPTACPRKFNIHEIHRFRMKVKATVALASEGHSFGARFAYDRGQCVGRCFPGNFCSCTEECDEKFTKYGFVVGCNNFYDLYPFPDMQTTYPSGVWYSLPLEGRCDSATGAHNCTWSMEKAGVATLTELESVAVGSDQCCDDVCTDFWNHPSDYGSADWRVQQALDLFHRKYPDMPQDPNTQGCDFSREQWYGAADPWVLRDPWNKTDGCMKERFDEHVTGPYSEAANLRLEEKKEREKEEEY